MNLFQDWASLFSYSSFYFLNKNDDLNSDDLLTISNSIKNYKEIEKFHDNRKQEFLLGRLCAAKAYKSHFGKELFSLPMNTNRSPVWPSEVLGSITHNESLVGAAVADQEKLLGLGIDFEVFGRTKLELSRYIRSPKDIQHHSGFNQQELLTLIFSAKESLYKALHPSVNLFFGFEVAALQEINSENGSFKINLISNISPHFGPSNRYEFDGRFQIYENNCLTVLEILK